MYKYCINEMLANLPMKDYKKALKIIPMVLNISPNTFFNYRSIRAEESRDIPYQKMLQLEQIFGVRPGGLQNVQVKCKHISELLQGVQASLGTKCGKFLKVLFIFEIIA